ncbi:MAG: crosslink repair DNA glycosylase YcaQ family protein, partial [Dermatophilaceae bacterium]
SATELREQVPELAGQLTFSTDKTYGGTINIAPRVLTVLGAEGRIMRADNAGHWRTSRPRWIATEAWLGGSPERLPEAEGYAVLVSRWLRTFGPGTENDIVWWLGATRSAVRRALSDLGAVAVRLEDDRTAWVAAGDTDAEPDPGPWAALLPVLDPTAMGWKERDFYLDPADVPYLVDTNGNIGTTAWWCGRVVGGWVQDDDGSVRVVLRSDPGPEGMAALEAEAARLTEWFDGVVVSSVYKSQLMKGALLP